MSNERREEKDAPSLPRINREIAQRLGEMGIGDLQDMPRKTKKAAQKAKRGRPLGSQELARLQTLRQRPES